MSKIPYNPVTDNPSDPRFEDPNAFGRDRDWYRRNYGADDDRRNGENHPAHLTVFDEEGNVVFDNGNS